MIEQQVTITNPSGLHARPASLVTSFVKTYDGKVEIIRDTTTCNLKSILSLLSMGLHQGAEVTLRVDGPNEEQYMQSLVEFIQNLEG
ncbi:HPr family phosphocarrier protein [Ruminococcaceae bacterium OttesenSCG-928-D13]|nr:HPr family phosphocarrier protein [Ruminococcaceae bacterium OttesenSCG-928-D13]